MCVHARAHMCEHMFMLTWKLKNSFWSQSSPSILDTGDQLQVVQGLSATETCQQAHRRIFKPLYFTEFSNLRNVFITAKKKKKQPECAIMINVRLWNINIHFCTKKWRALFKGKPTYQLESKVKLQHKDCVPLNAHIRQFVYLHMFLIFHQCREERSPRDVNRYAADKDFPRAMAELCLKLLCHGKSLVHWRK